MLTKNFERLRSEVSDHVKADRVAQGSYSTCFIGCLANGNDDPEFIENKYGIPVMVTRIAEEIFEGLPADEAIKFFAAIPQAVACDGKDPTLVGWKFLATELRSLPPAPDGIQAVVGQVINGMDLLGEGKEWPLAAAWSDAVDIATDAASAHTSAEADALLAAAYAGLAAASAHEATRAAAYAGLAAPAAARATTRVAWSATNEYAIRLRQRDTLLQLISEAPITQKEDNS